MAARRRVGPVGDVLSFAAYRQSLDTSLEVGTAIHADLHRYPGPPSAPSSTPTTADADVALSATSLHSRGRGAV